MRTWRRIDWLILTLMISFFILIFYLMSAILILPLHLLPWSNLTLMTHILRSFVWRILLIRLLPLQLLTLLHLHHMKLLLHLLLMLHLLNSIVSSCMPKWARTTLEDATPFIQNLPPLCRHSIDSNLVGQAHSSDPQNFSEAHGILEWDDTMAV